MPASRSALKANIDPIDEAPQTEPAEWKSIVAPYTQPSTGRAIWQIVNTFVPYAALWYLMYLAHAVSWWLVVPLVVLAAGFQVRAFIIFHDCGHGSFFRSRRANDVLGSIIGLLTFTPYYHWRWEHALHHASAGDLDRRGTGDIWTMTVKEYVESPRWRQLTYKLVRNPVVLFVIGPLILFAFWQRFPSPRANPRERRSVLWTNLGLLGCTAAMGSIFGIVDFVLIQLAVVGVAGMAGVWLFYVQHQFEGVYWERRAAWDYTAAALKGSSFYKLPKVLQWFSGNIGFHHVHHLSPRIPNYNLEECHEADPLFKSVKALTLLSSMKSFTFRLWDEGQGRLVGYRRMREFRRQQARASTGR